MCNITKKVLSIADKSTDFRDKVGAIILDKKGRIVSWGFNKRKTHPLQLRYSVHSTKEQVFLHAEISALVRMRKQGHTIVVARKTKSGRIGLARPCPICAAAIEDAGIKYVMYTTNDGDFIKERI